MEEEEDEEEEDEEDEGEEDMQHPIRPSNATARVPAVAWRQRETWRSAKTCASDLVRTW